MTRDKSIDVEAELIERARREHRESLETIVRLHSRHLYKACLGLGFRDFEAEDIIQNVWITFFDKLSDFEGRSSVRTFLFGILYKKASEFRRKNNRMEPAENMEGVVDHLFDAKGHWLSAHTPLSPDRFLESAQTGSIISKCMELLPIKQRMAFVLKEVEEENTEDICNTLQVTGTNLGVLLFRARNQLRECIERKTR